LDPLVDAFNSGGLFLVRCRNVFDLVGDGVRLCHELVDHTGHLLGAGGLIVSSIRNLADPL